MQSETELLIRGLNQSGVVVSIDYEIHGTYSVILLTKHPTKGYLEYRWGKNKTANLYVALQQGQLALKESNLIS